MNRKLGISVCWILVTVATVPCFAAGKESPVVSYLKKGDLKGGQEMLEGRLKQAPDDAEARFSLGIVQFLGGVERLSQSLYKHGLQPGGPRIPFMRLDLPVNRNPEPIDYAKLRKILSRFNEDLDDVAATLRKVDDPEVQVRLPIGLIKLDLDGDGKASDEETFWRLFVSVGGPQLAQQRPPQQPGREAQEGREPTAEEMAFEVAFDQADVHWFRGYTHVLRAMLEMNLAHDGEDFFKHTGHVFFAGAKPPYEFLNSAQKDDDQEDMTQLASRIADVIAAIHLMKLKPTEPERLKEAHEHLLAMVEQSRECVRLAGKETDNDREWIPNPKQVSVVPMQVTAEQIETWGELLDEWEALLEGKKLLPHWNIPGQSGINLKKVFHEPRDFDLILWIHGAGVAPFLEKGERTDPDKWREMNEAFRGNLFFVAIWFN